MNFSTLNNYMLWHLSKLMASYLSKPFRDAKKEFSEVLSGKYYFIAALPVICGLSDWTPSRSTVLWWYPGIISTTFFFWSKLLHELGRKHWKQRNTVILQGLRVTKTTGDIAPLIPIVQLALHLELCLWEKPSKTAVSKRYEFNLNKIIPDDPV